MHGSSKNNYRDFTKATEAVAAGDLSVTVPIASSDELGALGASFNEMVAGMRERESLRLHNDELVEELRASRARLVAVANRERQRMERDLHDGAQQHLVLVDLKLALVERTLDEDPVQARQVVAEARTDVDNALDELRDLAHGIYPSVLTNDGLASALEQAGERAAIATRVECEGLQRYSSEVEAAVYFCCLEALQNASKHAGEDAHATVSLTHRPARLEFAVADDGPGFEFTAIIRGSGLQSMADRIGALGGRIRVHTAPGEGTSIEGGIPLDT